MQHNINVIIFDYVEREVGAITRWRAGLQPRQQAALDAKTKMLRQWGFDLPPALFAGPLKGHPHLYKLRIQGDVALRPVLCKGHVNLDKEVTFLIGATERDRKIDPANAFLVAEQRRASLVAGNAQRTSYQADQ